MKRWVANAALRIASRSEYRPYQHGAVLENGGRIVAIGVNQSRPFCPQTACSIHAEVAAIISAGDGAKGCTLYVARMSNGQAKLSKPCGRCLEVIVSVGIKRVYYTVDHAIWSSM